MLKVPNETLCTECGNRGFKLSTPNKDGVPAYECLSCGAKIYTLYDLMQAPAKKE